MMYGQPAGGWDGHIRRGGRMGWARLGKVGVTAGGGGGGAHNRVGAGACRVLLVVLGRIHPSLRPEVGVGTREVQRAACSVLATSECECAWRRSGRGGFGQMQEPGEVGRGGKVPILSFPREARRGLRHLHLCSPPSTPLDNQSIYSSNRVCLPAPSMPQEPTHVLFGPFRSHIAAGWLA